MQADPRVGIELPLRMLTSTTRKATTRCTASRWTPIRPAGRDARADRVLVVAARMEVGWDGFDRARGHDGSGRPEPRRMVW